MTDNVVYLGGKSPSSTRDDAEKSAAAGKAAVRSAFLQAIQSYRKGEVRGVAIITIDQDGSTWRVAGNCTDFEIVAALEYTKTNLITEG